LFLLWKDSFGHNFLIESLDKFIDLFMNNLPSILFIFPYRLLIILIISVHICVSSRRSGRRSLLFSLCCISNFSYFLLTCFSLSSHWSISREFLDDDESMRFIIVLKESLVTEDDVEQSVLVQFKEAFCFFSIKDD